MVLMNAAHPTSAQTDHPRANAVRVIKKYSNRRLYDTTESHYITLENVRHLVLESAEFRIVDARTDEDITRNILLQVIAEQEAQGQPILSADLLQQIIRFYGDTMQGLMSNYLESSLRLFVEQQNAFREQLRTWIGPNPLSSLMEMAERNLALWKAIQERYFKTLATQSQETPSRAPADPRPKGEQGDKPSGA
jgi:polyhydroxyalkanoate synthesis repressor PhaR